MPGRADNNKKKYKTAFPVIEDPLLSLFFCSSGEEEEDNAEEQIGTVGGLEATVRIGARQSAMAWSNTDGGVPTYSLFSKNAMYV